MDNGNRPYPSDGTPRGGLIPGRSRGRRQPRAVWWLVVGATLLWFSIVACNRQQSTETPDPSSTPSSTPPATELATAVAEVYPGPVDASAYPAPVSPAPIPSATPSPDEYPAPGVSPSPTTPQQTTEAQGTPVALAFMPLVSKPLEPTPTFTPTPKPTSTPTPTPTPTIDFSAVRAQLRAQGQELGFVKIGFHAAVGGNRRGLGVWLRRLDQAGVPFFLKSADDAGPLYEAQEIVRASETPHVLVYRRSGDQYDTPNYDLPPAEAARRHWQLHKDAFPSELDPSLVWLETINEVDKGRSRWLAQFALETARLALADGFRWAAFGWSSGEPEAADWETAEMLAFLRLAAANPERLAIALHEYSFSVNDIADQYPFKVGRFHQLFQVADRHGMPRPTVLITEWGWEYDRVPSVGRALEDIEWAAAMYAPFPEIKGAAIWYLGGGFGGIAEEVQRMIAPVTELALGNYWPIPIPPARAPADPALYRP